MNNFSNSATQRDARYKSLSPLTATTFEGANDADLSISELSVTSSNASRSGSAQPQQPFSLLARPSKGASPIPEDTHTSKGDGTKAKREQLEGEEMAVDGEDETVHGPTRTRSASGASTGAGDDTRMQSVSRSREERLRHDLFVMRKLNDAFALYNDSLGSAQSATEVRVILFFRKCASCSQ